MAFMTFHILGRIIPTDELIFFREVETTNQKIILITNWDVIKHIMVYCISGMYISCLIVIYSVSVNQLLLDISDSYGFYGQ